MSKTNEKFKKLSLFLCFILVFDFLVLNFGIKPKEVKAAEISSIKTINYDIKVVDNYIVFNFSKYLSEGENIEELSLLKGTTALEIQASDSKKKAWRTREVLIHGTTYQLNIKCNIGGTVRKFVSTFVYNDHDLNFKPIMSFSGNDIHCDLKAWAANFQDDLSVDVDILLPTGSVVVQKVTKTIREIKANKIVFQNKKSSIEPRGYVIRAKIKDVEYRSKIYFTYGNKWTEKVNAELISGVSRANNRFDLKIKIDKALQSGEMLTLYAGGENIDGVHEGNNVYKYENVEVTFNNEYHLRLKATNERTRETMFSFCSLDKIEKLDSRVNSSSSSSLNFDLSKLSKFLSHQTSKNKISIYELNDNFGKGNKIGEKTSVTASNGVAVNLNSGVSLSTSKNYLVEVTNGSKSISSSFMYVTMGTSATEVKETSAKINWTYPTGYNPASGDKVEIYLRDKQNSSGYSSVPNAALVHGTGSDKVDLSKTTSTVVTNLAPGINYEAKVILNNQRGSVVSFTEFTTKGFRLNGQITIKDAAYDTSNNLNVACPRSRTITVEWDFDESDINFSSNDKVEIWIKPNSSQDFSGYPKDSKYNNPVFTRTGNDLRTTKTATVTIPKWLDKYHVDLIYTIGGKQIITRTTQGEIGEAAYNRRTVTAHVNKPNVEITDITQTSAKVTWVYDYGFNNQGVKKYEPENGHIVKVNVKKVSSKNDITVDGFNEDNKVFYKVHGVDGNNILNITECELTGLEVGQYYRVRLQHVLHHQKDNDGRYALVEEFCNFKTEDFSILNLKAEQQTDDSRNIKLTWGTSGNPQFEGDSEDIKVYLKESNTSEYPTEPLSGVNIQDYSGDEGEGQVRPTKQCIINVPKYNTTYSAKLEYTLRGGKKIFENVLVEANGDISLVITDITDTKAKIGCTLPIGYKKHEKDKVKLTVTEQQAKGKSTLPNNISMNISGNKAEQEVNNSSNGIQANKTYDVKIDFENEEQIVDTVRGSFKATNDFQIVDLNVSDVKSTTGKLSWDFTPSTKLDSPQDNEDKVEIYLKKKTKPKSLAKNTDPDDALTDFTKIYTMTQSNSRSSLEENVRSGDNTHSQAVNNTTTTLKTFKELNLTKLKPNEEYEVKVKYNCPTTLSDSVSSGVLELSVPFKTVVDTFKATVFTSNQTTANYGWEYPPGYNIQDGDKVDIYITEVNENGEELENQPDGLGYKDPLLTLEHGSEEDGKYDLNSVTRVDVSGLTPERNYKSKIEFTMGTGDSAYTISTEVKISTKSFAIKSFTVDSYQEYDILAKWEIEPENMMFNPADKLEIFVKIAEDADSKTDEEITSKPDGYPADPVYVLTTNPDDHYEGKTIADTFSDYVLAASLGVKQKMLLVYTVGDRKYYKECEFINTINPVKAEVTSVDETRALISVTAPDNYEFVTGDRLLIYAKDEFVEDAQIESEDFLVFEGVQTETLSIPDDMKMIELSYLLPEAKYEILVALDLEDGTVEPAKLEFTTTALPVSDIKLESLKHDSAVISWNYGENEIDFFKDENSYDFTDKLIIVHKEADGTAIPDDITAIKNLSHVEYLGEDIRGVKDATIKVEDTSKDYDVAVCYDLGGLLYKKNFKASYLSVKTDEESLTDKGVKINWKYPSNVTFGDGDKTEVFIRKKDDANYPEAPLTSSTGSATVSYTFDNLEVGTEYIAKVQITKEGLQIDPVELEFKTKEGIGEETVIEEITYEITGTSAQITVPGLEGLEINKEEKPVVSMGDEAYKDFTVKLTEDGTGVIIEPTIPKKVYKNIEVTIPLADGSTSKIVIAEFVTQPENVGQDWLSNAYKFALDRFPDEGGYKYWYEERIEKKTMSGEYFLMNLLFGEDEFTNRNLGDKDLIAALYQIVVNRDYDEEGLNFWIGIYNENLGNAQGNKKLAQEVLVDRMVHEAEFGKLCEKIGIFWTKKDQEAAGVPM